MKWLLIDFDSTFVRVESLDELARIGGAQVAELERITKDGMEGRIDFGESLARRMALLEAGRPQVRQVVELLKSAVSTSVAAHADWIRAHASQIYVISGGFTECISPVVRDFGIEQSRVLANQFVFDDHGAITGCDAANPLAQENGKTKAVRALGLEGTSVMVGDGWSDYMVRLHHACDRFVAYTENVRRPGVVAGADAVARHFGEVAREFELVEK